MKGTWKIHYLGFGVRTLKDATLNDAVWKLGAEYGGIVYNEAIKNKIITIDEVNNTIVVRPTIYELQESMKTVF